MKFKNRDGDLINFELQEKNKTVEMSEYSTSFIRIGEENNSAKYKKENPIRDKIIQWVDVPGGPFIGVGFDLNAFLLNKEEFLNSNDKKIIKNIDIQGPKIIFSYETITIKKKSEAPKTNSTQEGEY